MSLTNINLQKLTILNINNTDNFASTNPNRGLNKSFSQKSIHISKFPPFESKVKRFENLTINQPGPGDYNVTKEITKSPKEKRKSQISIKPEQKFYIPPKYIQNNFSYTKKAEDFPRLSQFEKNKIKRGRILSENQKPDILNIENLKLIKLNHTRSQYHSEKKIMKPKKNLQEISQRIFKNMKTSKSDDNLIKSLKLGPSDVFVEEKKDTKIMIKKNQQNSSFFAPPIQKTEKNKILQLFETIHQQDIRQEQNTQKKQQAILYKGTNISKIQNDSMDQNDSIQMQIKEKQQMDEKILKIAEQYGLFPSNGFQKQQESSFFQSNTKRFHYQDAKNYNELGPGVYQQKDLKKKVFNINENKNWI